ncbi:MAG: hypothetical protein Q7K55_03055 [Candidatus Levybacteria bacterium]|nr:hypothetical protein [Candidatus Levybacteria bacterium]
MISEAVDTRPKVEQERQSQIYVMKFGGSSVGNAQAIEETVRFIDDYQKDSRQTVVVVSAMNGITDQLVNVCSLLEERRPEVELLGVVCNIRARHMEVVSKLNLPLETRSCLERQLDFLFFCLGEDMAYCDELTLQKKDSILAYGERLSAKIVAAKLSETNKTTVVDSAYIIKTDDQFSNANVDRDITQVNARKILDPLLKAGFIPIVTGFSGSTSSGQITTLGRNSSDYSAAILGRVLNAREVWICKGVKGIYRIDSDNQFVEEDEYLIPSMTKHQADYFLQTFGDKPLCLKAVSELIDYPNTALRVRGVSVIEHEGTIIGNKTCIFSTNGRRGKI